MISYAETQKSSTASFIILGIIIIIIVSILLVTAILDKKKEKKLLREKEELEKKILQSQDFVVLFVSNLISKNEEVLNKFIVSIGPIKMKQIRQIAKEALINFSKTEPFQLAFKNNPESEIMKNYFILKNENCNLWIKNCQKTIKFFNKLEKKIDNSLNANQDFVAKWEKKINNMYYETAK